MDLSLFDPHMDAALEGYLSRSALPILIERGDLTDAIGTGTIYRAADRHYVITANHILTEEMLDHVASPLGRTNGAIHTWGAVERVKYNDALGLDVTVIELKTPEVIAALSSTFNVLNLSQIGVPSKGAEHWIVGFPYALTQLTADAVKQAPFILKSSLLDVVPPVSMQAKQPDPRVDLFFQLDREGMLKDGTIAEVPPLQGVSGAAVWEIVDYDGPVWVPGKGVRAVGVQQSAAQGAYVRATRWELVTPLLYQLAQTPKT